MAAAATTTAAAAALLLVLVFVWLGIRVANLEAPALRRVHEIHHAAAHVLSFDRTQRELAAASGLDTKF